MAFPIGITSFITDILWKACLDLPWEEVVAICRDNLAAYKARIPKSGDTALHIAVSDGQEYTAQVLVDMTSLQARHVFRSVQRFFFFLKLQKKIFKLLRIIWYYY